MRKILLTASLVLVAGMAIDRAASAAEGEYFQGAELALGMMPVDQVVTGGPRWKKPGVSRMPTSRDNRQPHDSLKGAR
ncbi:MAG: hypothetical protein KJ947_22145 [Alphaproteobacteria bacterium]|nr:hypothetical protein [Alphaproteobacteria bacterium]MBU1552249.1 hypothetical protein [Alphaproteobacteria bacterium]MBU2336843.1 hypothetical protein [Alphaproteobacteria bacterium]MBU2389599.1 hypothetical protein [Alphaproteobacteria bacterium]|tara:strand:- start:113 stop:346 length:234 start_codon:yes stop_codon:yes gene_type:complete